MPKRKQANPPGAPRGRFREGGSRKATEIALEAPKVKSEPSKIFPEKLPDPVPPDPPELDIEEPEPAPEIPDALIHELRLRSLERRDAGTEPWTLKDIVTEALRDWLSKPKNK